GLPTLPKMANRRRAGTASRNNSRRLPVVARHPEGDAVRAALMYGLLVTPVGQHDNCPGPQRPNQCDARHPYEYLVRHQEIEQNTDQHEGCRDVNPCCWKASPVDGAERGRGLAYLRKSMKHSPSAVEPTIARRHRCRDDD